MIIKLKKGVKLHVELTRQDLKKRGFKLRTFKYDTQKISVLLTEEGKEMYQSPAEALLAIRLAIVINLKKTTTL